MFEICPYFYRRGSLNALEQVQIEVNDFLSFDLGAEEIEESTEKLLQDLKAVVRDGEELLRAGANEIGERGMAAREKLSAALEVAKDTRRKLEERAIASARATDRVIREHPYESIGAAFSARRISRYRYRYFQDYGGRRRQNG